MVNYGRLKWEQVRYREEKGEKKAKENLMASEEILTREIGRREWIGREKDWYKTRSSGGDFIEEEKKI